MEELLLGGLRLGQELDVVHHQHVHVAHAVAQLGGALLLYDGVDQLVGEALRRGQQHVLRGIRRDDVVADGVHLVGLAQADAAVDEQRIVGRAGLLRHGEGRRIGKAVAGSDHEVLEAVLRVQRGLLHLALLPFQLLPGEKLQFIAAAEAQPQHVVEIRIVALFDVVQREGIVHLNPYGVRSHRVQL